MQQSLLMKATQKKGARLGPTFPFLSLLAVGAAAERLRCITKSVETRSSSSPSAGLKALASRFVKRRLVPRVVALKAFNPRDDAKTQKAKPMKTLTFPF